MAPIHRLPPNYHLVYHFDVLETAHLARVQLAAFIPFAVAVVLFAAWHALLLTWRGPRPGGPLSEDWVWLSIFLSLLIVIVVHEALHGLVIALVGHRPRFGVLWRLGAFYATADGAYFPRDVFVAIALAPIVVITLVALIGQALLPDTLGYLLAWAAALNAGSSIGDLWMTAVVRRYPPDAIVQDLMTGINIFTRTG